MQCVNDVILKCVAFVGVYDISLCIKYDIIAAAGRDVYHIWSGSQKQTGVAPLTSGSKEIHCPPYCSFSFSVWEFLLPKFSVDESKN